MADPKNNMLARRWMWIAWPAFLIAGLLEMLVFALVDPSELHWQGKPLELSRQAIYTVSFFVFWALAMASSALTTLLAMSPFDVNHHCSVPPDQRPASCGAQRVGTADDTGTQTPRCPGCD